MLIHLKQRGFGIHLTTSKSPESYCVGGMCFIPLFEALMIQDLVKDWFRETHILTPWKYAGEDKYLNIQDFLVIGCKIPVSSAKAKHSTSSFQRIKSYLRNRERSSCQDLMHHGLHIHIHNIPYNLHYQAKEDAQMLHP